MGKWRRVEKHWKTVGWKDEDVSVLVDNNPHDLLTATGSQLSTWQGLRPAPVGIMALRSLQLMWSEKQSKQTEKPGESAPNRASLATQIDRYDSDGRLE